MSCDRGLLEAPVRGDVLGMDGPQLSWPDMLFAGIPVVVEATRVCQEPAGLLT